MPYVAAIALVLLGLYASRRLIFRAIFGAIKRHPDIKARMELVNRSYLTEESVVEEAEWFGKTGLSDEYERELPKYLRREFGELLIEEDSLKARDLKYIGSFQETDAHVHYWSIPSSDGVPTYAYIEVTATQVSTGWGSRVPPEDHSPQQITI